MPTRQRSDGDNQRKVYSVWPHWAEEHIRRASGPPYPPNSMLRVLTWSFDLNRRQGVWVTEQARTSPALLTCIPDSLFLQHPQKSGPSCVTTFQEARSCSGWHRPWAFSFSQHEILRKFQFLRDHCFQSSDSQWVNTVFPEDSYSCQDHYSLISDGGVCL